MLQPNPGQITTFLKTSIFAVGQTRRFLAFYDIETKSEMSKKSVLAYSTIINFYSAAEGEEERRQKLVS